MQNFHPAVLYLKYLAVHSRNRFLSKNTFSVRFYLKNISRFPTVFLKHLQHVTTRRLRFRWFLGYKGGGGQKYTAYNLSYSIRLPSSAQNHFFDCNDSLFASSIYFYLYYKPFSEFGNIVNYIQRRRTINYNIIMFRNRPAKWDLQIIALKIIIPLVRGSLCIQLVKKKLYQIMFGYN